MLRLLFFRLSLISLLLIPGFVLRLAQAADVPVIAAASDLEFALTEISDQFRKETGLDVKISFGSSGNFYRQISEGAPFQLFMSADEQYVLDLSAQGLTLDQGALYAIGQLVLFAQKNSPLIPDADFEHLRDALKRGVIKHFAIANPEHAPYGRAAKSVLSQLGMWDGMIPHLVLGENVLQTAQFALSEATQGGMFAYSIALSPKFKDQGCFVLIPSHLYPPLRQRMVLLKSAGAVAKTFYQYLQQPAAKAVLMRYGFSQP